MSEKTELAAIAPGPDLYDGPRIIACQAVRLTRLKRLQPEQIYKLRLDQQAAKLDAAHLVRLCLVGLADASLLYPGEDGLARLKMTMDPETIAAVAREIMAWHAFPLE